MAPNWAERFRTSDAARVLLAGVGGLSALAGGAHAMAAPREAQPIDLATVKYKGVVFVGMNEGSSHEVSWLKKRLGNTGVDYIGPQKEQDTIKIGATTYDLKTPEGRAGFVAKLGLTGDRAAALESLLDSQGELGKDELARLAVIFDQAERGERNIERIVFSGHSVGSSVWGDENGTLYWSTIGKLGAIFPQAAGQVQDLLIAACYSGGHYTMDTYRAMFPNVKTIWAYDGSAPGSFSGAVPHILRWETGTKGPSTDKVDRAAVNGIRKGENVAVWTISKGYDNGQPAREIGLDRDAHADSQADVPAYESGESEVVDTQTGALRTHYNNIQRLLSRGDLPAAERSTLETERDHVIRLIYFTNVKTFFNTVHGPAIQEGYQSLGMSASDLSKMSRKEILEEIGKLSTKLEGSTTKPAAATYLLDLMTNGLKDLKPAYVPNSWI